MAPTRRLSELAGRVLAAASVPDGPIVVALSGGADSAVVAWVAAQTAGGTAEAVHVDHGLPGSPMMAAAAARVAGGLGLPLRIVPVQPGAPVGSEGDARRARYRALEAVVEPGVPVLLGHTADDQAETFLLSLFRGAGLDGLAGMAPVRGRIHRPLLGVDRSTVRELAVLLGLGFADDPANEDLRFLRNRIRTRLLPQLEAEYASGLRERLAATAALLERDRRVLEERSAVPLVRIAGGARVPIGALVALGDESLVARAIRSLVRSVRPPHGPSEREVQQSMAVLEGSAAAAELSGGVRVTREGPWFVARTDPVASPAPSTTSAPGIVRWGGWSVETVVTSERPPAPLSTLGLVLPLPGPGVVEVRAPRPGDRIGLPVGSKRVMDAFSEAGVPRPERRRHPVVLVDGELVWLPGVRRTGSPPAVAGRYLCAVAVEESPWDRSGP
jgi:tRNA(Ile)-lysidine synthase